VIIDNDKELRIKLKLCQSHDFIMELLSHGDSLKVLEPKSLVDEIRAAHLNAYQQYQNV
jgi:predicted DNA-binding transcriptional regulator YafY